MEVAPLSPNQRCILEAVVSGQLISFVAPILVDLSQVCESAGRLQSEWKPTCSHSLPSNEFRKSLSLISLFAQRIEKPNQQKLSRNWKLMLRKPGYHHQVTKCKWQNRSPTTNKYVLPNKYVWTVSQSYSLQYYYFFFNLFFTCSLKILAFLFNCCNICMFFDCLKWIFL